MSELMNIRFLVNDFFSNCLLYIKWQPPQPITTHVFCVDPQRLRYWYCKPRNGMRWFRKRGQNSERWRADFETANTSVAWVAHMCEVSPRLGSLLVRLPSLAKISMCCQIFVYKIFFIGENRAFSIRSVAFR